MSESTDQILVITRHDPAIDDDIEFVNYTPSNLLNQQHRKAVNSFVNSVKRRKLKQIRPGQGRHGGTGRAGTKTSENAPSQHSHSSLVRRDGEGSQHANFGHFIGGLRTDPFNSYPVQARDPVTNAVDVCKDICDQLCNWVSSLTKTDGRLSSVGSHPYWTVLAVSGR
jgi:hypothetical protein